MIYSEDIVMLAFFLFIGVYGCGYCVSFYIQCLQAEAKRLTFTTDRVIDISFNALQWPAAVVAWLLNRR